MIGPLPCYQAHQGYPGICPGLFVSRKIVYRHGGRPMIEMPED